jgi:hypothetical protein
MESLASLAIVILGSSLAVVALFVVRDWEREV